MGGTGFPHTRWTLKIVAYRVVPQTSPAGVPKHMINNAIIAKFQIGGMAKSLASRILAGESLVSASAVATGSIIVH